MSYVAGLTAAPGGRDQAAAEVAAILAQSDAAVRQAADARAKQYAHRWPNAGRDAGGRDG
jgi:hypothetical protein